MSFSIVEPHQTPRQRGLSSATQAVGQPINPMPVLAPASSHFAAYRPAVRGSLGALRASAASQCDEGLAAWLASLPNTKEPFDDSGAAETWKSEDASRADDVYMDSIEQVFAQLTSH